MNATCTGANRKKCDKDCMNIIGTSDIHACHVHGLDSSTAPQGIQIGDVPQCSSKIIHQLYSRTDLAVHACIYDIVQINNSTKS